MPLYLEAMLTGFTGVFADGCFKFHLLAGCMHAFFMAACALRVAQFCSGVAVACGKCQSRSEDIHSSQTGQDLSQSPRWRCTNTAGVVPTHTALHQAAC